MGYNFIPCDREQQFLMPPSLDDWLPKEHLARFVIAAVDTLDLSRFFARRRSDGWGRAAYDPKMMVALLIYAYASGTRSSRMIERRCLEDIAFRFICANETPDHATIARFIKNHEDELADLFAQVLRLATEVGLVRVGVVALDSTQLEANASPGANRSAQWIDAEVKKIIAEARQTDDEEDLLYGETSPNDMPEELIDPDSRLARLLKAKARLDQEAAQRRADYEAKLKAREEHKRRTGKSLRGRKPKPPEERAYDKRQSKLANTTDPDSRTMMTANGGYIQGFNVQTVATEDQITIACGVTNVNDYRQLKPMVEQAKGELKGAGVQAKIGTVVADAGYASEDNFELEKELDVELLIATKKLKRPGSDPAPRGRIPKNLTKTQRMERKLQTKRGRRLYKKRAASVEPVFGQQRQRGVRRFRRRGRKACECELRFEHAIHNLLKIRTSGRLSTRFLSPSPSISRPCREGHPAVRCLRSA